MLSIYSYDHDGYTLSGFKPTTFLEAIQFAVRVLASSEQYKSTKFWLNAQIRLDGIPLITIQREGAIALMKLPEIVQLSD